MMSSSVIYYSVMSACPAWKNLQDIKITSDQMAHPFIVSMVYFYANERQMTSNKQYIDTWDVDLFPLFSTSTGN